MILSAAAIILFAIMPFPKYAIAWPYLFTGWQWVDMWVIGVIAVCSILNLIANIGLAKAYQSAESTWLVPFDYSYLLFATIWGVVIWKDMPDGSMITGMFLITGAGIFVTLRDLQK